MNKVLVLIIILGLLSGYAPAPVSHNNEAASKIINLKEKTVSSNKIDIDKDTQLEEVQIVLDNGYFTEDNEMWSGNGPKWVGKFSFKVLKNGKIIFSESINKLMGASEEIFLYSPEFKLCFNDYNKDGQLDFTVSQYFSSNGSEVYLFSIDKAGKIKPLEIENKTSFFTSPRTIENSLQLDFEGCQIAVWYYDNVEGVYFTDLYGWDELKNKFVLIRQEKEEP